MSRIVLLLLIVWILFEVFILHSLNKLEQEEVYDLSKYKSVHFKGGVWSVEGVNKIRGIK